MPQLTLDNQALAQIELDAYIQQQSAPQYEIDSVPDVFGELYLQRIKNELQINS